MSTEASQARMACRYCTHAEAVLLVGGMVGGRGSQVRQCRVGLRCVRSRNATVLHDDSCGYFEREPGSDDDIGC